MPFEFTPDGRESPDELLPSLSITATQIDSVANVGRPTPSSPRKKSRIVNRPHRVRKDDPDLARRVNDFLSEERSR